jgi:uncharacterized phage-associated protein
MKTVLEFDYRKATQAVNFFVEKAGGEIDKMKVVKLLWLSDRAHLRRYGRPIINDIYYAMEYGPVASSLKDILGHNLLGKEEEEYSSTYLGISGNTITSNKSVNADVFSDSDIEKMELVWEKYGSERPFLLANFSHSFPEWKKYEEELKNGVSRVAMNYLDFFENPSSETKLSLDNIFNESGEELKTAKQLFQENYKVANYWV